MQNTSVRRKRDPNQERDKWVIITTKENSEQLYGNNTLHLARTYGIFFDTLSLVNSLRGPEIT